MGADIYLESVTKVASEKFKPLFDAAVKERDSATKPEAREIQKRVSEYYNALYPEEGYFRDSYNNSCLLWALNLSWWKDVVPMLNKRGYLSIKNAKKLRDMVANAPLDLASITVHHKTRELADTPQEWLDYWAKDRVALLAMLDRSINLKEPLRCSL